jgi:hypothetical protein
MVGVSSITSCRQLLKELNILTLASLYLLEVICFIRKYHQSVEINSNVHTYNTQRKMDIHIQSYNTEIYKKCLINMGTKIYNKLPGYIKEIVIRPLRKIISSSAYILLSGRICIFVTV